MKKKIFMLFAALCLFTLTASAQFEEGKFYGGASLTGLNMSYDGTDHFNLGAQAQLGYFFADNLMIHGDASFQHTGADGVPNEASVGAGLRYYIIQNGLFLGAGAKLLHANHDYNDLMPEIEVGYAFFISHTVTIEPAIYYDQSFKNHSDHSKIGLRVGFGIYL